MGKLLPLDRDRSPALQRVLVLYRLEARALTDVLPRELEPRLYGGSAVCEILYTHQPGATLLPPASDRLSFRFPVTVRERGEVRPATWILRRGSSSWLEAAYGERILGTEIEHSSFVCDDRPQRLELRVLGREGLELDLRAVPTTRTPSALFAGPRAVEAFLAEEGAIRPRARFARRTPRRVTRSTAAEPMAVLALRTPLFERDTPFPRGSVTFDSVWRFVERRSAFVDSPATAPEGGSGLAPAT